MVDGLRLATAGSVDDGKSTLIGRLLHDAGALMADQVAHVEEISQRRGAAAPDLALVTDGLRAEREQGITIDVAYRYFATPRRRFRIADTPGHRQYTRNMVTGASTADLAVVLVDVTRGFGEQSRRHLAIAALLGIRHVVVAVNKLDLVGFAPAPFAAIRDEVEAWAEPLAIPDLRFVPMSALEGDNVVTKSPRTPWYDGGPLLELLETVELAGEDERVGARLPVQWVVRDAEPRRYAGRIAAGRLTTGDELLVLPAGQRTRVTAIHGPQGEQEQAGPGESVAVCLEDDLDVARGDLLAAAGDAPAVARELAATVCWLGEAPVAPGARYLLKSGTRWLRARVEAIEHRLDVTTLATAPAGALAVNDLGVLRLRLAGELAHDPYSRSRETGSFILVDEATNDTVGAGMVA